MTKHWITRAEKNGQPFSLYVTTSDRSIATDLAAGRSGSLILDVREMKRRTETTADTDHLDLAVGAFSYHISHRGFTQSNPAVAQVDRIPDGLQSFDFGGTTVNGVQTYAVSVFEQPNT
jgi:hypothetical protein